MEQNNFKKKLVKDYLDKKESMDEKQAGLLLSMAAKYENNTAFLSELYAASMYQERYLEDEKTGVKYERDGVDYFLTIDEEEIRLSETEFRDIISSFIDILEDVLPLGTVVDLKKEFYHTIDELKDAENIRMVITHRFLGSEGEPFYFPYAGVVYPTGMLGIQGVLHFTRPLIKSIVKLGYTDMQEEAFVLLMKHDLIVDKGYRSFGYADDEAFRRYSNEVKGGLADG